MEMTSESTRVKICRALRRADKKAVQVLGAASLVLVMLSAGYSTVALQRQVQHGWKAQTQLDATAAAVHTELLLDTASAVADGVRSHLDALELKSYEEFDQKASEAQEFLMLRKLLSPYKQLSVVALFSAQGQLLNSSREFPAPTYSMSSLKAIRALAGKGDAGAVHLSAPVLTSQSKEWTVYVVKQVLTRQGVVLGFVVVGLPCEVLSDFFSELDTQRDVARTGLAISLLREDRTILARYPTTPLLLSHQVAKTGAFKGPESGLQVSIGKNIADGNSPWETDPKLDAQVYFRKLTHWPVVVSVAQHPDAIRAEWRSKLEMPYLVIGLCASLLCLVLLLLVSALGRRDREMLEMRALRELADTANKTKSDFLAAMSHEIRTPLHGIIGTAQMLRQGRRPEDQDKLIQTLVMSGRNLLTVVNDILDFSKMEAGQLRSSIVAFSPHALGAEVVDLFYANAVSKGIELAFISASPRRQVMGEAFRLRQVLANLVGNAVKFTERGQVLLCCTVMEAADMRVSVRFEVKDTGCGMTAQDQQRVFLPFEQGAQGQQHAGGSGLGLAISRRLVRMMGSDLHFESRLGRGTRFWFDLVLPGVVADSGRDENADGVERVAGTQPRLLPPSAPAPAARILIVEDNPVNALVTESQLTQLGYTCDVVNDGDEALAVMSRHSHDLILMDCTLPGLSGQDVTIRLRQMERDAGRERVPIVALTARSMQGFMQQCLEVGMSDYLMKPCDVEELDATIRKWLAKGIG